jgi:hypothetical protein
MFDLSTYVALILNISKFDYETHGPALKSFSPTVDNTIRDWLLEQQSQL